jgi:hypothetical protein
MHRTPAKSGTFIDRIEEQKKRLEADIARAKSGPACGDLQKKLRQLDVALHLNEWLSSPGLQAPR